MIAVFPSHGLNFLWLRHLVADLHFNRDLDRFNSAYPHNRLLFLLRFIDELEFEEVIK